MDSCLDANDAIAFVEGELSRDVRGQSEAHLAGCPSCRRLIAELARSDDDDEDDDEDEDQSQSVGTAPSHVGRYEVRGLLGRGGMGEVYEAYDPKLDRLVALKLVSPQPGESGSDGHGRLVREAHALAKLAHPNVVSIFDVGEFGERVFIAMELVEGVTLRQWLTEERSSKEILAVFIAAGQGLAAAHRRQMVHRDFKPANVLVGNDGRPRVLDFGLVRASGGLHEAVGEGALGPAEMTQTGVVVGTPAYMAPEQFVGGEVDPRADQFSFAVALHEALYGRRPFAGSNLEELARAVCAGVVSDPPSRDGVSSRAKNAIVRALSRRPADRFASIEQLLSALEPRRAIAPLLLAGGGMITVVALGVWAALPSATAHCQSAGSDADSVWTAELATQVRERVGSSGYPTPEQALDRIEKSLSDYQTTWRQLHMRACRATHVEKTQTQARFDHQLTCLYDGLERAKAIGARLARISAASDVDDTVAAAAKLPALEQCETVTPSQARRPLPPDELRDDVISLRAEISRASSELDMSSTNSVDVGERIVERVRVLGFAPLTAEALFLVGRALNANGDSVKAEATLREAVTLAAETNYDPLLAQLWIEIIVALYEQAKYNDAIALAPVADAAMLRAGSDARVRARGLHAIGVAYWWKPDLETAKGMLTESAELLERTYGASDPDLPLALTLIAELEVERGEPERALPIANRSITLAEAAFGRDHTISGWCIVIRGMALVKLGRYQEALEALTEVRPRLLQLTGGHHRIAWVYQAVGDAHGGLGDHAKALAAHHQGMAISVDSFGADDFRVSIHLRRIGRAQATLGQSAEGRESLMRALAIRRASHGSNHIVTSDVQIDLAWLDYREKKFDDALRRVKDAEQRYVEEGFDDQVLTTRALRARLLWQAPATRKQAVELARGTLVKMITLGQVGDAAELKAWLNSVDGS